MEKNAVIAITGAAGFIGSCLTAYLNQLGFENLLLIDDFSKTAKAANYEHKIFSQKIDRLEFWDWCSKHPNTIRYFFHLGARTDTTETDYKLLKRLNLDYSKQVWQFCAKEQISLVYASSAATYGDGALGYKDDENIVSQLKPLNAYGRSKNEFDLWTLNQEKQPPFYAGLKFFNVYGPNEYHKGRMASVIFHAFNQIREQGKMKLFRSHRPDYKDGGQLRDFIYVKDVLRICTWLMQEQPSSGLYNVGTGKARSFSDLAKAVFDALNLPENVEFIDTPPDIRDKYQYFTEADMHKLRNVGYTENCYTLEDGIKNYVDEFLKEHIYF